MRQAKARRWTYGPSKVEHLIGRLEPPVHTLTEAVSHSGARIGEILGLTAERVLADHGKIVVVDSKRRTAGGIALTQRGTVFFARHARDRMQGEAVFVDPGVGHSGWTVGLSRIDRCLGPVRIEPMRKHRTHSIAFKRQVVEEYLAGERFCGLARRHNLSRTLIRLWVEKYEAGAFDKEADTLWEFEAGIATLERLVGRQAAELEFLKGARRQGRRSRSAPMSVIAGPWACPSPKDAD